MLDRILCGRRRKTAIGAVRAPEATPTRLSFARAPVHDSVTRAGEAKAIRDGVFLDHVPVLLPADFPRVLFPDADGRGQERRHADLLSRLLRMGRAAFPADLAVLHRLQLRRGDCHRPRATASSRKSALALAVAVNLLVLGVFKYANFVTGNFAALAQAARAGTSARPTSSCRSASRSSPSTAFPTSSTSTAGGSERTEIPSTLRSISRSFRSSSPARSSATRPWRASSTRDDRRSGALRWARASSSSASHRRCLSPTSSRRSRGSHSTRRPIRELAEAWIGLWPTPCRSISISPAIRTWRSASASCSASPSRAISACPTRRCRSPSSGAAGTCRCRRGCATIFTSRLAATAGPNLQTYRNLVTVFVLCGAWHGANWTFILWGVWHGAFLVIERLGLGSLLARTPRRAALGLCAARGDGRLGACSAPPTSRPRLDYFASLVGRNGVGDISFDMHDALNERAIATLIIGCALAVLPRWLPRFSAPLVAARRGRFRLDLRACSSFPW